MEHPTASRPPTPRRPTARALFLSSDASGVDEVRTNLAIAWEIARRRTDVALVAVHGCLVTRRFPLPENFDDVQLPVWGQRELFDDLPSAVDDRRGIVHLRAEIALATARAYAPDLVVVAGEAAGIAGEFGPALRYLSSATPRPWLALCLFAAVADRSDDRQRRPDGETLALFEEVYDHILADDSVADEPFLGVGCSESVAAKLVRCGRLTPDVERLAEAVRLERDQGVSPPTLGDFAGLRRTGEILTPILAAAAQRRRDAVDAAITTTPTAPAVAPARRSWLDRHKRPADR